MNPFGQVGLFSSGGGVSKTGSMGWSRKWMGAKSKSISILIGKMKAMQEAVDDGGDQDTH